VSAFLTDIWRAGMLFGQSPEQAFYVKCDEELNPPEVRDWGQLIIEFGLAPVRPAEFIVARFSIPLDNSVSPMSEGGWREDTL
jgi:phage tail sheath protein FI